jgi:hypothetical protein
MYGLFTISRVTMSPSPQMRRAEEQRPTDTELMLVLVLQTPSMLMRMRFSRGARVNETIEDEGFELIPFRPEL